jgi:hypothetical protein
VLQGPAVCRANAQYDCGAAYKSELFAVYLPLLVPSRPFNEGCALRAPKKDSTENPADAGSWNRSRYHGAGAPTDRRAAQRSQHTADLRGCQEAIDVGRARGVANGRRVDAVFSSAEETKLL